ncbi:HpcH/HpaI aldolase/citrate lyase family protein [Microbacterium sp. NPDC055910]|uniref:HpcH/HpaI aldolase family protein n=1 Tax=Microbacterium sp. NPDC055910 TaxID=3345659 RepID=UPI0035D5F0C5
MRVDPAHAGPARIGLWVTMLRPFGLEIAAAARPDWIGIDLQHGDIALADLADMVRACERHAIPVAVRAGGHDPAALGRIIDTGADAVIVPAVESAAQTEAIVRATRVPPRGARSTGIARRGLVAASIAEPLVLPMIETAEGLENVDAILDVDGIDGVFVGPYDLSLSMRAASPTAAPVVDAIRHVLEAARTRGLTNGIYSGDPELTSRMGDVDLLAAGSDVDALRHGLMTVMPRG